MESNEELQEYEDGHQDEEDIGEEEEEVEEEEDILEEDEEEISDVDDEELMKKLEAKYGKLPSSGKYRDMSLVLGIE